MKLPGAIIRLISICIVLFSSCRQSVVEPNRPAENKQKEELIQANKNIIKQEAFLISKFAERVKWNLKETESGLWIETYKQGKGEKATVGKVVTIKYKLSLLDGTLCYSSDSTGNKQFTVGSGKVEAGLDEGIQTMQKGSAAHIIIPPHLGYGLMGDGKCIPSRAILVYDIELLEIN